MKVYYFNICVVIFKCNIPTIHFSILGIAHQIKIITAI